MQRVLRHPLLAALLAFLSLIAVAMLPIVGVASAASASTTCPSGEESGPTCILAISAPESVPTGQTFTVQVAVTTDGTTVAKSDPCKNVEVSLSVFPGGGEGPDLYLANTSGGIATFNVIVTSPGFHTLDATATNTPSCSYVPDSAGFMAVTIAANQPIAPCPDNVSCLQTTSNTGSAATLFADTGSFSASFGTFVAGCNVAGPADSNGVLTFDYTGGDPKTIVLALRSDLVTKGIGLYKICWRSTIAFTQLGGTPAPSLGGFFTGYLPNCAKKALAPCVLFRTSGQHNVAFFGILAPPGDPQTYPE